MQEKIDTLVNTVTLIHDGQRLDVTMSKLFSEFSRAKLQSWIRSGHVQVDDITVTKTRFAVKEGQKITLEVVLPENTAWKAQDIPLTIVYEDEHLLVINKPVGMVVHPGAGNPDQTLVNALLHYCEELNTLPRAGIIHRLDKDTSGLLVISKSLAAHAKLVDAMQKRLIHREYRALVEGRMIAGGSIDKPMGRHPTQRTKMAVVKNGKPALTHYRVLKHFKHHTYLQVKLETGRTHQIRVHLSEIGYPIIGDPTYGKKRRFNYVDFSDELQNVLTSFSHQALHAYCLSLQHPITGDHLSWTAPLPSDFDELLTLLELN